MRLILVRHGETAWNRENRVQGRSDTPLSDAGISQAGRLAESIGNERIVGIVTSPLRRAVETASIINRCANAPLEIDEDLMELDQGMFEGMRFGELSREHAEFLRRWAADPAVGGDARRRIARRASGEGLALGVPHHRLVRHGARRVAQLHDHGHPL